MWHGIIYNDTNIASREESRYVSRLDLDAGDLVSGLRMGAQYKASRRYEEDALSQLSIQAGIEAELLRPVPDVHSTLWPHAQKKGISLFRIWPPVLAGIKGVRHREASSQLLRTERTAYYKSLRFHMRGRSEDEVGRTSTVYIYIYIYLCMYG